MINLKIDPEFQSQIPPLTDDEFKQLEENILKEGKLLSPLIVWNNTLVDGHNRYAILQKHPEIYFSTMPLRFESREEVLAWICKNQLGRRNLTPEQKYYLMGKQYEAEKAAHGGDRKSTDAKFKFAKSELDRQQKTCDRIAEENSVSKDTVIRASRYMRGVEIAEELIPGLKQNILSGQTKVSKADMHRLAKAAYYDRAQTLQDILHPELKVEPTPDADGVIRVPGKAPVMPFRKFESVYDSDAYPEDVRYDYVALEENSQLVSVFHSTTSWSRCPIMHSVMSFWKSFTSIRTILLLWKPHSQMLKTRQHNIRHMVCCSQMSKGACV